MAGGEEDTGEKQLFVCGLCSVTFEDAQRCRIHMKQAHPRPSQSEDKTEEDEEQEDRQKEPHPGSKKQKCPFSRCQYRFAEPHLTRHLDCHSPTEFRCPDCRAEFKTWRRCALHLWNDHMVDIDLLSCPLCDSFKTVFPAKLENHLSVAHSHNKVFRCRVCEEKFDQLSDFRNHAVVHLDKSSEMLPLWLNKRQCDLCLKFFSDSKSLKKHVQSVHSKLKPYICHVCNHQAARKAMLEMHMRQHTGGKPYRCEICDYRTADHNSLRRHRQGRHSGHRPYKCPLCPSYSCIQAHAFKNHLMSKHGGKLVYTCKECSYRTISQESYVGHTKMHERETKKDVKVTLDESAESSNSLPAEKASNVSNVEQSTDALGQNDESDIVPMNATASSEKPNNKSPPHTSIEQKSKGKSKKMVQGKQTKLKKTTKKKTSKVISAKPSSAKEPSPPEEEDSLYAPTDLGGTTIPATEQQ